MIQNVAESNSSDHQRDQSAVSVPCPRCGYDQRGVMSQWTDACPLQGVCAECGLAYFWAELLAPEKYEPKWCVEFAPRGPVKFIKSCIKTAVRTLWPWMFWKRQNMAFDVRWRRLAMYWLFLLLLPLLLYPVEQAAVAVRVRMLVDSELTQARQSMISNIPRLQKYLQELSQIEIVEDSLVLNRWAIESEAERQAEIARIQNSIQVMQYSQTQSASVNQPLWRAIYEAVFTPFSSASNGKVVGGWNFGIGAYPAPDQLHNYLFGYASVYVSYGDMLGMIVAYSIFTAALLMLIPIEFALLPISRRKAKVQWRHVWRVAAYSVSLPAWVVLSAALLMCVATVVPEYFQVMQSIVGFLMIAPPLLLIIWWAVAIKRYLRMPHGWLIAPVFAILSVLVLVAIVFWGGQMIFGPQVL